MDANVAAERRELQCDSFRDRSAEPLLSLGDSIFTSLRIVETIRSFFVQSKRELWGSAEFCVGNDVCGSIFSITSCRSPYVILGATPYCRKSTRAQPAQEALLLALIAF